MIVTKNEADRIQECLYPLNVFDEVIVIDSGSTDDTATLASACGAQVVQFSWNGLYPKKRQWCLDTLTIKHDWVFFVDGDEIVTPSLIQEIRTLFEGNPPQEAGFFIAGQYVWNGTLLRFGLRNKKIALLNRHKMAFPVVDDLDLAGMGEIEGHYQPVLKPDDRSAKIRSLRYCLLHNANHSPAQWLARHQRYATWEIGMNKKQAWPDDPDLWRRILKKLLRYNRLKPGFAFLHSYILKAGFLDGTAGFDFAKSRWLYYKMIMHGTRQKGASIE